MRLYSETFLTNQPIFRDSMSTCDANETALASGLGHVVRRKNTKGKVKVKEKTD